MNAFRDDSTLTVGSVPGGASSPPGVAHYRLARNAAAAAATAPPPPPLQPLPYIMDASSASSGNPPQPLQGGRIMPVPLPQGFAPPAHYNHQGMPQAPPPRPYMGGGSGPGVKAKMSPRGAGARGNRPRSASGGGGGKAGAAGEEGTYPSHGMLQRCLLPRHVLPRPYPVLDWTVAKPTWSAPTHQHRRLGRRRRQDSLQGPKSQGRGPVQVPLLRGDQAPARVPRADRHPPGVGGNAGGPGADDGAR